MPSLKIACSAVCSKNTGIALRSRLRFVVALLLLSLLGCSYDGSIPLNKAGNNSAKAKPVFQVQWYEKSKLSEHFLSNPAAETQQQLANLLSAPWDFGDEFFELAVFEDQADPLDDPVPSKERLKVNTCQLYFKARDKQMWNVIAFEWKYYRYWGSLCEAVKAISSAADSSTSYLRDFRLDAQAPDLLPTHIALVLSISEYSEYERILADPDIRSWADAEEIKGVTIINDNHAKYALDEAGMTLKILARGDFNGDHIEDILLETRSRLEHGAYTGLVTYVLTRKSKDGRLEFINEYRGGDVNPERRGYVENLFLKAAKESKASNVTP